MCAIVTNESNLSDIKNCVWGPFYFGIKKVIKGAMVAPGGFGFRTCPSNIINNKTLAIP